MRLSSPPVPFPTWDSFPNIPVAWQPEVRHLITMKTLRTLTFVNFRSVLGVIASIVTIESSRGRDPRTGRFIRVESRSEQCKKAYIGRFSKVAHTAASILAYDGKADEIRISCPDPLWAELVHQATKAGGVTSKVSRLPQTIQTSELEELESGLAKAWVLARRGWSSDVIRPEDEDRLLVYPEMPRAKQPRDRIPPHLRQAWALAQKAGHAYDPNVDPTDFDI